MAGQVTHMHRPRPLLQRTEVKSVGSPRVDDLAGALSSPAAGEPLRADTRSYLEPRLGHSLANVRIHTDSRADELAQSVQAEAFTTGNDIYVRSGAYDPSSRPGVQLLAHEATHTLQQAAGPVAGTPPRTAAGWREGTTPLKKQRRPPRRKRRRTTELRARFHSRARSRLVRQSCPHPAVLHLSGGWRCSDVARCRVTAPTKSAHAPNKQRPFSARRRNPRSGWPYSGRSRMAPRSRIAFKAASTRTSTRRSKSRPRRRTSRATLRQTPDLRSIARRSRKRRASCRGQRSRRSTPSRSRVRSTRPPTRPRRAPTSPASRWLGRR